MHPSTKKQRILIVDDAPENIRILATHLSKKYSITIARSGKETLEVMVAARPDLIILDIIMPEMDGFAVCRKLKAEPTTQDIPIIFVTAMNQEADESAGLALGAVDYITKPFNPAIVEARVSNHLSRHLIEKANLFLSQQNQMILNAVDEGIYGTDCDGKTTFVNPAAVAMVGWSSVELIGQRQHEILHHSYPNGTPYPREQCYIYAAFKDGQVHHIDNEVFWRKDGSCFPVEYTSSPVYHGGEVAGAVVVFRDISQKIASTNREIRSQASRIAVSALLETSLEPMSLDQQLQVALEIILSVFWLAIEFKGSIFITDPETGELVIRAQQGLNPEQLALCGRIAPGFCLCGQAAQTGDIIFANNLNEQHQITYPGMYPHGHYCVPILSQGQVLGVLNLYLPFGHEQTAEETAFLTTIAFTLANVIKQRQLQEKLAVTQNLLQHAASHDKLTGLPNRALFHERLDQGLLRAVRNQHKMAILFIDLDRFKQVNDTQGHAVGDELLVAVAKRVRAILRESDTVARLGGDEFAVILAEIYLTRDITNVAEKIIASLQEPFPIQGSLCQIGSSIGISIFPDHGDSPDTLLKHADDAMYAVKRGGRNHYRVAIK